MNIYAGERRQQCRIEESMNRRKWKWIGHTLRKPENNITRSALKWSPQGPEKDSWSPKAILEARGGGGGTPLFGLYGDVPLDRVWFFGLAVLNRVYLSRS